MRNRCPCDACTAALLAVLLIVLSGCSRGTSPAGPEKKAEAATAAASAQEQAGDSDKGDTATAEANGQGVVTVKMPAAIDDLCVGAGGKLLIVRLKSLVKLAVLDVGVGKVSGYVSLDSPADVFVAGAEKLVVINPDNHRAKRYALADLKQEAEQEIPVVLPIVGAGMGASSQGPLFVVSASGHDLQLMVLDPATLQSSEYRKAVRGERSADAQSLTHVNASADGSVLCVWNGHGGTGCKLFASLCGNHVEKLLLSQTQMPYTFPDDIGDRIYTGRGLLNSRGEKANGDDPVEANGIQAIAEVPDPRDIVLLHHLNMEEELRRICAAGTVIVSRPPRTARVGETLRYQIDARTKSGKPVFKLDTGPEGMTLSETGLVEWSPPPRLASTTTSAVISIQDSGQTKFHTVSLTVQPPPDVVASADDGPGPDALAGDKPIQNIRLNLPAAYNDVCVGGNGRFLVFRLPTQQALAVFDVVAAKIIGRVPVEGECLFAAGRDW